MDIKRVCLAEYYLKAQDDQVLLGMFKGYAWEFMIDLELAKMEKE